MFVGWPNVQNFAAREVCNELRWHVPGASKINSYRQGLNVENKPFDNAASVGRHSVGSAADETSMEEALRCAQRALEIGEVPVGAVVVCEEKIIGRGWNRNLTDCDPTAHAEVVAMREAAKNLGNHRLVGCDLFVTIEPCAMCAAAATHARIRRLVYGADDPKAGAVESVLQVVNHPKLNHRIEVRGGVLAGRSAEIIQEFFRSKR
jgi:tRNA(adenine34) deaminase